MIVVAPEQKTSLLINRLYQPFSFCTARAAIRHLMSDKVKGIDAMGNVVSWSGADMTNVSSLRWFNNEVNLYEDQPCLRSAPDATTGYEKRWAIPTILVCNHSFGIHKRRGENCSLKTIYNVYKGVCQYCYEKIPYIRATKDHVMPKSLGGSNDDFNIVLACRECNNKKNNIFPFLDIHGKEVKPRNIHLRNIVPENVKMREEWKPFFFWEH